MNGIFPLAGQFLIDKLSSVTQGHLSSQSDDGTFFVFKCPLPGLHSLLHLEGQKGFPNTKHGL
jgi:hypothetical protein